MLSENEKIIYRGGPSQVLNYNIFFTCAFVFVIALILPSLWKNMFSQYTQFKQLYFYGAKAAFFLPPIVALVFWLKVHYHNYTITSQRLTEAEGVLSRSSNELELYRVKDISLDQPFSLRAFGCGNIVLDTSDKTTPIVTLQAIKAPKKLVHQLRELVEKRREEKGVREID